MATIRRKLAVRAEALAERAVHRSTSGKASVLDGTFWSVFHAGASGPSLMQEKCAYNPEIIPVSPVIVVGVTCCLVLILWIRTDPLVVVWIV